jgi:hypothetical protein
MDWTIEENGKVRAKITQLPLRLAWAITVHKSQGMSLDEAAMDLGRVFEYGQGYVALSRLRRLSGLYLLGFNNRAFLVHPEVLQKDAKFRQQSQEVVGDLTVITPENLLVKQQEFVQACGGASRNILEKYIHGLSGLNTGESLKTSGFDDVRKTHTHAYLPWDDDQDEKLQELFIKNTPIADLASTFNRTKGAIRSRLVKLGFLNKKTAAW